MQKPVVYMQPGFNFPVACCCCARGGGCLEFYVNPLSAYLTLSFPFRGTCDKNVNALKGQYREMIIGLIESI